MYKKISVALCIVISLFFIVPLAYLWWNMEPSKPQRVLKGPFAAIYLKNLTALNHTILLHDIPSSDFILDRSIWEWDVSTSTHFPSSSPFSNRLSQPKKTHSIILECHANFPVKWEYKGDGGLVLAMRHFNRREIKSIDDNSTFWFTAGIEFFTINEQISGKYVCSTVDDLITAEVYLYIYVKGYETFLTKEEITKEVEPDSEIVIPCPISDPEENSSIVLKDFLGVNEFSNVESKLIRQFDPKVGFRLEPNNWGTYRCVNKDTFESSGITKIYKPRRLVVKGDYLTKSITALPLAKGDPGVRVICESTENVTLSFINMNQTKRRQVYFKNESYPEFPYSTRFIMRNEYLSNYTTVECRTIEDGRLLRVWTYLKQESLEKTVFKFDPVRKGFECCSDTGVNILPSLTQATCYSQAECEMKKSCVNLEPKCPDKKFFNQQVSEGNPGCALVKVDKNPSGILQCSFRNSTKTFLYFYNEKAGFHNFTSSDFRKKRAPVKQLLKAREIDSFEKDFALFECSGPKFFFTNGFQWGLKGISGTIEHLINQSIVDEESDEEVRETIKLPISKLVSKRVICFAPSMFSFEWVNATVRNRRPVSTTLLYDDDIS